MSLFHIRKAALPAIIALLVVVAGCGSAKEDATASSTSSTTASTAADWSSFGVKTKTDTTGASAVNHDDYKAGDHATLTCNDCHAAAKPDPVTGQAQYAAREAICVTCHALSKYTATNVNHTAKNTGTQCNKCHYSAKGATTGIAGWRSPVTTTSAPTKRTRVDHAKWHPDVKGTCLDCHNTADIASFPTTTHTAAKGRTTACETCHFYKSGKWGGGHSAVTSGCTSCHSKHYSGYQCEWCHTGVAAGGFTSWALSFDKHTHRSWNSNSCAACHGAGGSGN